MAADQLENCPTFIPVVAAAIFDVRGGVLLQRCLPHKRHAGLWEFPGGKVENGETPRFALCREIREELAIELDESELSPAGMADEPACKGHPALVLFLYKALQWRGVPEGREGQEWGWFTLAEAASLPLPPMDSILLDQLAAGVTPKSIAKPVQPPYVAPSTARP